MADLARQGVAGIGLAEQFHARIQAPPVHDRVLGIARGEQHRDVRQALARLLRQLRAAQGARHHDVGEQQVDVDAAVDHGQGRGGVAGAQHPVAQVGQHVDHGQAHLLVVLDHQHGLVAAGRRLRQLLAGVVLGLQRAWQVDLDRGAFADLAVDLDVAARLLDQAVHHRQPQARALALGLGREEGLEGLVDDFLRHAAAGVAHGQQHVLAGRDLRVRGAVGGVQRGVGDLDGEPAGAVHGVAGVDRQVQDRVLELRRVDLGGPQAARDHHLDVDLLAQGAPHHVFHAGQQAADLDRLRLERLAARERQQGAGQLGAALDAVHGVLDALLDLGQAVGAARDQLQVAADDLQQVVEVVRHAAGQLADGLHFLGLLQRGLGAPHGLHPGQVGADVAAHRVDVLVVGRGGPGQVAPAAVLAPIAVLEAVYLAAQAQHLDLARGGFAVVRVHQVEQGSSEHLGFKPAQDGRERRVHGRQGPLQVGHQHDVLRQPPHAVALGRAALDPFLERGVDGGQRVARALLVLDVDAAADPQRAVAGLARLAPRAHQVPAVFAIVAAHADLGVERGAGGHAGGPQRAVASLVVRMHQSIGTVAQQLRALDAGVFVHAVVDPFDAAVLARRPHVVGHGLGEGAKARLAGAQRALGAHPLGDVVAFHEGGEHRAVRVPQRLQHEVDEEVRRRVQAGIAQREFDALGAEGRAFGEAAVEHLDDAALGQFRHRLRHRQAEQGAVAGQRAVGFVGQGVAVFGAVQQADEAGRLLEHRVQALALGAHMALGLDLARRFHHHRHHAGDGAVLVADRRIVEVHPDLLGLAAAVQGQFLVLVAEGAAGQAHLHHVVVEVGHLGPAFPHF